MSRLRTACLTVLVALLMVGCASLAERREFQQRELAIYQAHAGEPVDQIRSFRLISWQPVNQDMLLLEARLNRWYLLDIGGPCLGLEFARVVMFDGTMNSLRSRFDSVIVEGVRCRIERIRPIDYKAARTEIRAIRQR
ncbi:MAG: hypothetical protein KF823_12560 [Xanthomonadales bacterium]|nr:hypothetical protein [Xanthomonadales bacterium]